MTFLGKVQFIKIGEKYCIHIDLQQIIKVLSVSGGKGISRAVTAGKGVHKGVQ